MAISMTSVMRQRLRGIGLGAIDDDATARQKMRDAKVYAIGVNGVEGNYDGFDPDNVSDVKFISSRGPSTVTPMGYFAMDGDLSMMRWLYIRGADTRDKELPHWYPMRCAALCSRVDVCEFLFTHGAKMDVMRRPHRGKRVLSDMFWRSTQAVLRRKSVSQAILRWFLLRGAISGASGEIERHLVLSDLSGGNRRTPEERPKRNTAS